MATIVEDWLACLEQHGCRITLPVRAVVEVAATSTRILRPPQLLTQVRARHPRISPHTVNRTLARLLALGLIRRVHDAAGQPAFLAAGAARLSLVICERCGEAEFVECQNVARLLDDIRERTGFALRDSALQLFGVCAQCQPLVPSPHTALCEPA